MLVLLYSTQMPNKCNLPRFQSNFKVSIIGAGSVGATAAYSLLSEGRLTDLVLLDNNKQKAEGIVLDMEHSMPFFDFAKVLGTDDYSFCKNSNLVVITAGARQAEGETRLDLIRKNRAIFADIIPKIVKVAPTAILLVVTNPVDILTYEAYKISGFPWGRVFGSGTMLDTARFRFHISEKLCLSPMSVEAYILGEHGDSSFPVWSSANVAGKPLSDFKGFNKKVAEGCYSETKNAAYRIIHDVGFTCYSIATVIREIARHIHQHSKIVLPLSVPLEGEYGLKGVALSVPCVLDSCGVSGVVEIPLSLREKGMLKRSAKELKKYL